MVLWLEQTAVGEFYNAHPAHHYLHHTGPDHDNHARADHEHHHAETDHDHVRADDDHDHAETDDDHHARADNDHHARADHDHAGAVLSHHLCDLQQHVHRSDNLCRAERVSDARR
jgi:hypothetical protein